MKLWTYLEAKTKILKDLDLEDEIFINSDEMIGYFNEGLEEAESEIHLLNEDYFLTKYYVPMVAGTEEYPLPENIYADRIRGVIYANGSIIYPIVQYRRRYKFEDIANTIQFGLSDDYRYLLTNDVVGRAKFVIHPTSRDTAVLAPYASRSTPVYLWYVRNCARIPVSGEYCNQEIVATTQVSISGDTIQTYSGTKTLGIPQQGSPGAAPGSIAYITGDAVQFYVGPNGALPSPLVEGTIYYVIAGASGLIQLATSRANALLGTAINLTTVGTIYFSMRVAATTAIINATLLDIPEFTKFVIQWAKCRCMDKEGDPRLPGAGQMLAQQKVQMVDTLTKRIDDDDDAIEPDFTSYQEMS